MAGGGEAILDYDVDAEYLVIGVSCSQLNLILTHSLRFKRHFLREVFPDNTDSHKSNRESLTGN